jgi:DNA-binding CsgD family transcriptional regulator
MTVAAPSRSEGPGELLTAEPRKSRRGHVRDRQSPHEATTIEQRREHVARLVLDGNTYREIAELLDVSTTTIADDVSALRDAWRERYAEDFAAHASMELAKLDRAEQVLWPQIDDGKLAAIETFVKISRRRAQLLGLDRPERVEAVVASPTRESRSELPKTLGELLDVDEEAAREMAKVIHMAAKRNAGGDSHRATG